MPRNPDMPRPAKLSLSKSELLDWLKMVDSDELSRDRILELENLFRERIESHLNALPRNIAAFDDFNTNPFVLLMHSKHLGHVHIKSLENDILPAKLFSSMETSAGRAVEDVIFSGEIYDWHQVNSEMHTSYSDIDGRHNETSDGILKLLTLKSGPRCLNDDSAKGMANSIVDNFEAWAREENVDEVELSYCVLYGTKKKSNKKDWHILNTITKKIQEKNGLIISSAKDKWDCEVELNGKILRANIKIGLDWWKILGGDNCFMEIAISMIRACISPSIESENKPEYLISNMEEIVSLDHVPKDYNISLLQRSQLSWLFLFARHYCDEFKNA